MMASVVCPDGSFERGLCIYHMFRVNLTARCGEIATWTQNEKGLRAVSGRGRFRFLGFSCSSRDGNGNHSRETVRVVDRSIRTGERW